jgi:branched-chain amino acid transport system substrate-binding protein
VKRRSILAAFGLHAGGASVCRHAAASLSTPIKIGMSMPAPAGLAAGGKSSLIGIEIWRDDFNAKGGLARRKVELVVYDDKSSAAESPAIYAKLLDIDKVDILFAPYASVQTAPIMPLAKERGMVLMGNFSFQVNAKVQHDMWFNNAPWGPPDSWAAVLHRYRHQGRRQVDRNPGGRQEFAQNVAKTTKDVANKALDTDRL